MAVDDAYGVEEDGTLSIAAPGVLANDDDVEGDPLTAILVTGTGNGTLALYADGSFTYTPGAGFNGVDSFAYTADDGDGGIATATVQITVSPVSSSYLISFKSDTVVPGVGTVKDQDIVGYDPSTDTWSLLFDGSDVGVGGTDLDAVHMLDDESILMSFGRSVSLAGVGTLDDSDIARFIPTSMGTNTSGRWELYFDGSDVGLTRTGEDIDALGFIDSTGLYLSTIGNYSASGGSGKDEDVSRFEGTLGGSTSGTINRELDLSQLGISTGEDLDAISRK